MLSIHYYRVHAFFSNAKQLSDRINSTHVTFPLEHLKEPNATLLPEYFNYTISIVVYNSQGRWSYSTSKGLGMKISLYTASYVVVSCVHIIPTYV